MHRHVALITGLLVFSGIASTASGQDPKNGPAESKLESPVGIVTDPEVLAAAAQRSRQRAREKGLDTSALQRLAPRRVPEKMLPNDQLFPFQWHLQNTGQNICVGGCVIEGTPGIDVNVTTVWDDYTGAGQIVAIRESGIELTHPDLAGNYDLTIGEGAGDDPSHGTSVAGVVAAVEGNFQGGVGVAFDAAITRIGFGNYNELQIEAVAEWADVVTRSGGGFFATDKETLAVLGRGGLGTVSFQSAGNSRDSGSEVNHDVERSARHAVVVGSIDPFGSFSSFSNPGASLFLVAPGEYLPTTVPVGTGLFGTDYAQFFGTSAATPVAAGAAALMLEANPGLGFRDVREILAYSSRQIDGNAPTWLTNGARDWNGGGLLTSRDYGFGLLDVHAAVRLAETWTGLGTVANEAQVEATTNVFRPVPEGGSLSENLTLPSTGDVDIEVVELRLELSHVISNVDQQNDEEITDLAVRLRSPKGTESLMFTSLTNLPAWFGVLLRTNDPLPSVQFWGENGAGTWTLTIDDEGNDGVTATLESWTLTLYGEPAAKDDVYVYTDTFAQFTGPEHADRRVLTETNGGHDVLNAAAVTGDIDLDIRPGQDSIIAGTSLAIPFKNWIEDAVTGDGNDVVQGNFKDNVLRTGRGDDTIVGGGGRDVAVFAGLRADYSILIGPNWDRVDDLKPGVDGNEGLNKVNKIEALRFRDMDLAIPGPPPASGVDQAHTNVDSGGLEITASQTVAQTFTAGLAGTLQGVEIPRIRRHRCDAAEDLTFELVTTAVGVPSSTVLARVVVPADAIPTINAGYGSVYFDLVPAGIQVAAGDVLGVVLSTASTPGGCTHAWDGDFEGYAGGQSFISGYANTRDMVFRTFVSP